MDLKTDFNDVKAVLLLKTPFMSALLRKTRILETRAIETAGVTTDDVIHINPDFMAGLTFKERCFIYIHEAAHVAFRDAIRKGDRNMRVWNVAADCCVNHIISQITEPTGQLARFSVTPERIAHIVGRDADEIAKMSKEEIYRLLEDLVCSGDGQGQAGGGRGRDGLPDAEQDLKPGGGEGCEGGEERERKGQNVIQEGSKDVYQSDDRDEAWKQAIARAYTTQKLVGSMPAGLQEIIDNILRPKVNWKSILKQAFHDGMGKTIVTTWQRPSRKTDELPALRRFTVPPVHVWMDTSGSITSTELQQFLGEVYSLAGNQKVEVRCWDGDVYKPIVAEKPADVIRKVGRNIRGRGGTIIQPCLEAGFRELKHHDAVVILTDGMIGDIESNEVQNLMARIVSRSSVAIFASTNQMPALPPKWRQVKVEVAA